MEKSIRTPNAAEGFHRHLKSSIGTSHSNVFVLTKALLHISRRDSRSYPYSGPSQHTSDTFSRDILLFNIGGHFAVLDTFNINENMTLFDRSLPAGPEPGKEGGVSGSGTPQNLLPK